MDKREKQRLDQEEAARKLKIKQNQIDKDLRKLTKLPEFQRYMSDMMERGRLFETVMTGNSMTYHNSGKQDFAREIFNGVVRVDRDFALGLLIPNNFGDSDD